MEVLKDLPIKKVDAGREKLETEWMEGWGARPFGPFRGGVLGGQWMRRMMLLVRLKPEDSGGTEIRLVSRIQEKAPGGTQATRWQPVPSEGKMEREIFERIERELRTRRQ